MDDLVKVVGIWTNIIQSLAIIIAGIWAYLRFYKKREDRTQAIFDLEVEHYVLDDINILIRVKVKVKNVGNVF